MQDQSDRGGMSWSTTRGKSVDAVEKREWWMDRYWSTRVPGVGYLSGCRGAFLLNFGGRRVGRRKPSVV